MNIKEELKESFNKLYPGKRLLAIRLDGFSHSVWYDEGQKGSEIIQDWYSANMPEANDEHKNNKEVKQLFKDHPHYIRQGNPLGLVYVHPEKR